VAALAGVEASRGGYDGNVDPDPDADRAGCDGDVLKHTSARATIGDGNPDEYGIACSYRDANGDAHSNRHGDADSNQHGDADSNQHGDAGCDTYAYGESNGNAGADSDGYQHAGVPDAVADCGAGSAISDSAARPELGYRVGGHGGL